MADITINGASFLEVPYILVPKTTSGNAEFVDVTSDMSWLGKNPTFISSPTYSASGTLHDTSFNGWSPSTTAKTIVSSVTMTNKMTADLANYEYYLIWECGCDMAYTGTPTLKAHFLLSRAYLVQEICKRPSSFANITEDNFNGNAVISVYTGNFLRYYGTTEGTVTYTWSGAYGIYFAVTAPTFSNSTSDTPTITIKTPTVSARCSTTYFSTGNAALVDQENSPWYINLKIYRVRKNGIINSIYRNIVDLVNEQIE